MLFFFYYPAAACIWAFTHAIRHRCGNGPRLIRGLSAFPAEVPTGYLRRCFTSHCLRQGFETCPLINEHPNPSQASVLCSCSFSLYGFIRSHVGCKWERHCKRDSGQWKPVWNCTAFIFMEWEGTSGAGRWVSRCHSRYVFKAAVFQGLKFLCLWDKPFVAHLVIFFIADWIKSICLSHFKTPNVTCSVASKWYSLCWVMQL